MRPTVFITRPIQREIVDYLSRYCEVAFYPVDESMSPDQLGEALRDAEGVIASGVKIGADVLPQAPKLRIVANLGVGYDNVDLEACTQRHILVTNTPDVLTETTADLAFALILAVARRVVEGDRYLREGRWKHTEWGGLWGHDVHGKTLGLYGFGRIGQATARRGRGFSMRILYHSRSGASRQVEKELSAELVDKETLLRESDFISLHLPLTAETRHGIGAKGLALMKSSAFLINTARGSIVDEEALVTALQDGRIAGAGLDVFEHEPRVHPALLAMRNVVLMPHLGSATSETRLRMAQTAADNLLAGLRGQVPANLVNPAALEDCELKKVLW